MKVMILNGSPKKSIGASWYFAQILKVMLPGIETVIVSLRNKSDYASIIGRLGEMDALIISAPLYVDGIPSHMYPFMQMVQAACSRNQYHLKLYVISNGGFIEGKQSAPHLDMYRCWCERANIEWGGGLGIGGGVMLFVLPVALCARVAVLLAGAIYQAATGGDVAGQIAAFWPSVIVHLFLNAGLLFCMIRMAWAVRRRASLNNQFTRVMLPSFVFLVIADLFMVISALFNGKTIFSLYHKDKIEHWDNKSS